GLRVVGDDQLGVGALGRGVQDHRQRALGGGVRVTEGGHVDTHQLQLGGHVGAGELTLPAQQAVGDDLGGGVTGGHQAVADALDGRALTDGVDVGVGGDHGQVGEDATARAQ